MKQEWQWMTTLNIKDAGVAEASRTMCWFCGGKMIWQCDNDLDEVFMTEDEGIVATLVCQSCNATAQYIQKEESE